MIEHVSFDGTRWNEIPFKFEAGTPDIAGIVGLGRAIDWITEVGIERIAEHENELLRYGLRALKQIPGLSILGEPRERASVMTFTLEGVHPHDIGTLLDLDGIAVRTGHHCAHPLHDRLGLVASTRASLGVYNGTDDVDALVEGLRRVSARFA